MIKLADYVFQHLADVGVRHVFVMTGGGAMHLNDALGKEKRLTYICNHHEQACAMGAEGYARVAGKLAVVNVTTGPGGINALNGVFGAYTDSIPMLVISGQVKRETCMGSYPGMTLRQLGDQEVDIIRMAAGVTKYAVLVQDPTQIRYHLERAIHLAQSGRPGPTWLDIPVDVQAAQIDPAAQRAYDPAQDALPLDHKRLEMQCDQVLAKVAGAARPVCLVGSGVRLSKSEVLLEQAMRKLGIPVVGAWTGVDLLGDDDPLYCGRAGTIGDRAGNFVVQSSDVLLVLGSRLPIRQVGYDFKSFARHAFKIQVDVDPAELDKPYCKPDLGIACDLHEFLSTLDRRIKQPAPERHAKWLAWGKARIKRYPVLQARHTAPAKLLNPYHFVHTLFESFTKDEVIVCGNATASIVPMQAGRVQKGQCLFANAGSASMGYDLPAAIGAAIARGGKRVICFAGDGSLQLNIQELQTLVHYNLPVKLFVLNNGGYVSIRQSQKNFFGRLIGEGPKSGVTFPDLVKLAAAYGIPALRVDTQDFMSRIAPLLEQPGPVLFDVMLDPEHVFEPKSSSKQLPDGRIVSAPLEDLAPFLDRKELLENLLIPPLDNG